MLKGAGIELTAVWFPGGNGVSKDGRLILDVLKKHGVQTQLWVMLATPPAAADQAAKVAFAADRLKAVADVAAADGHKIGLYNHGGWGGEPENQLAVIEAMKMPHLGIVYNLHHGHEHLARFPDVLRKTRTHLLCVNLNGMVQNGDKVGKKILPLGTGDLDLSLLKAIVASGYSGRIGILGHTNDDAEERLRDNLDGLDWLLPPLDGKPAGPRPKLRTGAAAP